MEVEDQVELADVAKVAIEHLDKVMDHLQHDQLVVGRIDGNNKIQTGIATGGAAGATA